MNQVQLTIAGEPLVLLAGRAILLPQSASLVVADIHFGKAAAFRARGVPVPQGTTTDNLTRLDALLTHTQARRLIVLGDLFHAREAHAPATLAALSAWRTRQSSLEIVLVEGNHDAHAGAPPAFLQVQVQEEPWREGAFAFCHHPQTVAGATVLAGHMHPAVRLYGRFDSLRVPCFWCREGQILLPAFGDFTGGAPIVREAGDRVIAVADDRLFEIPAPGVQAA